MKIFCLGCTIMNLLGCAAYALGHGNPVYPALGFGLVVFIAVTVSV